MVFREREWEGLWVIPTLEGQNDSQRWSFRNFFTPKSKRIWQDIKQVCSSSNTRLQRITLRDQRLIAAHDGERTERVLTDWDNQTD
jgi:hypothetical protein